MPSHTLTRILFVLPLLAGPAFAQDQAETIKTSQGSEYGTYLTDGEGRSVYMFEADTQGQGDTKPASACSGDCLTAWPAVTTTGTPQAGEGATAEMLGTMDRGDGTMQVTYDGRPLYYYHEDTAAGQTNGQDKEEFGGTWYLVTAQGEEVEDSDSGGESGDDSSEGEGSGG